MDNAYVLFARSYANTEFRGDLLREFAAHKASDDLSLSIRPRDHDVPPEETKPASL